ncbi:MAG: metal ABC transporter permease [Candidatus Micrarchaeota archaeon]|nr:metal ABC transporter permease [Candidatus Micrarchaeota archaeon]
MIELIPEFLIRAILGGFFVALASSLVGVFLILRRMVLFGDGFSHIAFGGIALGLFLSAIFEFDPYSIAVLFSLLAAFSIVILKEKFQIKNDIALGVLFSFALSLGIILISLGGGFYSDIHSYLFGNILLLDWSDVILAAILALVLSVLIYLFGKQLVFASFDEVGAKIAGIPTSKLNLIFLCLSAILVVLSIRIVGVLLASSFIILPPATALLVAKNFNSMIFYSTVFALLAVAVGLVLSYYFDIAAGGAIVLFSIALFLFFSFLKKN